MKPTIACAWTLLIVTNLFTGCSSYDVKRGIAGPASVDANEPGLQDTVFVREALASGLHEIEMGRLGVERAQNLDLRLLAQKIFDDHDRAYKQLMIIAIEEEIPVPDQLMEDDPLANLRNLSGPEFDMAYMEHLLAAHQDDIKKFEAASRNARNSQVRDFAARTLPALQEHVRMAENVGNLAGLDGIINEPAGAERPKADPFYQGDPTRRHQFDRR